MPTPSVRNMGPFMALNKRPGIPVEPACPPQGRRPMIVGFPRRQQTNSITSEANTDRTGVLPWRYRA